MKNRIFAAAALFSSLCLTAAPAAAVQWNDGTSVHEYLAVVEPGISWDDARLAAQALGPGWDLATITSAAEQEFLSANLAELQDSAEELFSSANPGWDDWDEQFWLGAYQDPLDTPGATAGWTWISGEAWDFSFWGEWEPNDAYGPGSEQHAVHSRRYWNDEGNLEYVEGFLAERTSPADEIAIGIDIKPGSSQNPIQPGSRGVVPVAILSHSGWDAPSQVDPASLSFGRSGYEGSFVSCNPGGTDVNADGLPDLFCHFSTQAAGFVPGDDLGTLRGRSVGGSAFTGSDFLTTVPR